MMKIQLEDWAALMRSGVPLEAMVRKRLLWTLQDETLEQTDLIETMLDAFDIYGDERFLESARQGGEFFLLAQMPEPQPGWTYLNRKIVEPPWPQWLAV